MPHPVQEKYEVLASELTRETGIQQILRNSGTPINLGSIISELEWAGHAKDDGGHFYYMSTDFGFDEMFGVEMVSGRFFDPNIASDSNGIVVNEKALTFIDVENPVGLMISGIGEEPMPILGVMKDFHFKSIHSEIEPLIIGIDPEDGYNLMIKIEEGKTNEAIAGLQTVWKELHPSIPLEYYFLDEAYDELYRGELVIGKLTYYFAAIAIIVSCLGLLGLMTFMVLQRRKEISIRKVLGASTRSIMGTLTKEFILLVLIGLAIAIPLTWYFMSGWLNNFAYGIKISWSIFAITAIIALGVAMIILGIQSLRAAYRSPVTALKDD